MNKKLLKDEELLLLSRMGDTEAEQLLLERYFMRRFLHGKRAHPGLLYYLTPLDYNGVFFKVYLNAVTTYRFGIVTFRGYLQHILAHEINREVTSSFSFATYGYELVMLDTLVDESRSDDTTFHDIVADDTPGSDPRIFLNYADSLARLKKLPPNIDEATLDLVRLRYEGFSLKEAAKQLGISLHGAKNRVKAFREFAEITLNHGKRKD